jgi:hypothetical protein
VSKTDPGTWTLVTHSQPTALDRNGPLSALKSHYSNEHHVGKNSTVSRTNGETLSKGNKIGCFNSIEVLNNIVKLHIEVSCFVICSF